MTDRQQHAQLLIQAARLLLEYNESSREIINSVTATARAITRETCRVAVAYRSVTVAVGDAAPVLQTIHELRLNAAVQTRIHEVLGQVQNGHLDTETAVARLSHIESETPRHSCWLVALLIGAGACSFARLLGADIAAIVVAGISASLGLLARQELARWHFSLLALPFTAACIGAVLGGVAIRSGWTRCPELVLLVPALMIVPGSHLLNGLFDLVDNHLPMSLSRLGLSMSILLVSALGIVIGARLVLPDDFPQQTYVGDSLNLICDMCLAGVATCGFAAYFNTPWRQLRLAAVGGMVGHGLRYLAVENGIPLEVAAFFGGLAVGAISAWMAFSTRAPVAVIAFAGAVTMIPGSSLYRAVGGALRLSRLTSTSNPELAASTLSDACEGFVVVSGLAFGLVLGIRNIAWLCQRCARPQLDDDR